MRDDTGMKNMGKVRQRSAEKPDPFKDMLKKFGVLDTNKNNELEKEEFLSKVSKILPPAAEDDTSTLEIWEALVAKADTDKNGKISEKEFAGLYANDADPDEQGNSVAYGLRPPSKSQIRDLISQLIQLL